MMMKKLDEIKDYLGKGYEAETILEESGLEKNEKNLDFINAVNTLQQLKDNERTLDDWVAFEKIVIALSGKKVEFEAQQIPELHELFLGYLFCSKMVNVGEEIDDYCASLSISNNFFVVPDTFIGIQKSINRYLASNQPSLLRRIPIIKMLDEKMVKVDSIEYFQMERLKNLIKDIKKEMEVENV